VRVGRAALDEEAIRLIEEHNPDVEFDWTRILKGQGAPPPEPRSVERRETPRPPQPRPVEQPVRAAEPPEPSPEVEPGPGNGPELPPDQVPTAAGARLGSEALLRLRARHAEVLARISERVQEPERREQLKTEADRLNPDTWVTDVEVTAGLEQYESVFEALRSVVGRPRKRRRKRGASTGTTPTTGDDSPGGDDDTEVEQDETGE
jgi:hypothetical protein